MPEIRLETMFNQQFEDLGGNVDMSQKSSIFKKSLMQFFALLSIICLVPASSISESLLQTSPPVTGDTIAVITTSKGVIKAKLFPSIVPDAARNFIELARQGKYTSSSFHRVIKDFMIQGGDFTRGDGTGGHSAKGPGTTIADQYDSRLTHLRGALAWAKTSAPESIGSQFYIVHNKSGAHFLDHKEGSGSADGYTVFGQVYEGFPVLDAIATSRTDGNDRPEDKILIEGVDIKVTK